jgi:hypothetical protein
LPDWLRIGADNARWLTYDDKDSEWGWWLEGDEIYSSDISPFPACCRASLSTWFRHLAHHSRCSPADERDALAGDHASLARILVLYADRMGILDLERLLGAENVQRLIRVNWTPTRATRPDRNQLQLSLDQAE